MKYSDAIAALMILLGLVACSGGGTSGSSATTPPRIVFQENNAQGGALLSIQTDGTGLTTLSDSLEYKQVARGMIGLDSQVNLNAYTAPFTLNYKPMVQNGRVIYQQKYNSGFQDIYAVGMDGLSRTALAATADTEKPALLIGNRLIYTTLNLTTSNVVNIHSVLLDGSGDIALTSEIAVGKDCTPLGHLGGQLIYSDSNGTYIVKPDGTNKVLLWNKQARRVLLSNSRLVLDSVSEVVAVNSDGSGFASLASGVNGSGIAPTFGNGGSNTTGVIADRLYYQTVDSSVNPAIRRLHTIGLDGNNHVLLAESTITAPCPVDVVGGRLIVAELGGTEDLVSYDPQIANSRQLLLTGGVYMFSSGNRIVAYTMSSNKYQVNAVNVDGSASTPLTPWLDKGVATNSSLLVLTDGNRIAYLNASASGQIEGYTVRLDGTDTKQVTTGGGDKELKGVIGSMLVYESYATGNANAPRNLLGVNLDGSGAVDYASTAADERYWAQSANQLIFTSTDAGAVTLKIVPASGGTSIPLQTSAATQTFWGIF